MKSLRAIGIVPALGFSLVPTLTCPACLPALASVLGAVGLTFIAEPKYLVWLNLTALLIALLVLARSERHWISAPLVMAAFGATAVMLGKFIWTTSWIWWAGLGIFTLGSLWSGVKRRSKSVCINCESQILKEN